MDIDVCQLPLLGYTAPMMKRAVTHLGVWYTTAVGGSLSYAHTRPGSGTRAASVVWHEASWRGHTRQYAGAAHACNAGRTGECYGKPVKMEWGSVKSRPKRGWERRAGSSWDKNFFSCHL